MTEDYATKTVLNPGDIVEEKYRIISLLAEGGMGAVYHAVQEPLGRDVALKILKTAEETPEHRELRFKRFFREAALCSRLNHPNTVMIFDYGKLKSMDGFFLVMEFLKGESLRDLLNAHGRLSSSLALHITLQIAGSLADAHKTGVVHRDLKPPNIMLVERGDDKHFVKVVDFGLVKDLNEGDDELTAENTLIGSPMYMAPERFLYHNADSPVVDVYSLGIMLYEMLVGRPPFVRDSDSTVHRIMMQHIQEDPPPMRTFDPKLQLPEGLEALVMRCLAKQPGERYESMDTLTRLLKSCLQGNSSESSAFYAARLEGDDSGERIKAVIADRTPVQAHGTEDTAMITPLSVREEFGDKTLPDRTPAPEPMVAVTHVPDAPNVPVKSSKAPIIAIGSVLVVFVVLLGIFLNKPSEPVQPVAQVSIESTPHHASVYIDGTLKGTTPTEILIPVGKSVQLSIEAEGHETLERRFVADDDQKLSFELVALKAPEVVAPEEDPIPPTEPSEEPPPAEKIEQNKSKTNKKTKTTTTTTKTSPKEPTNGPGIILVR